LRINFKLRTPAALFFGLVLIFTFCFGCESTNKSKKMPLNTVKPKAAPPKPVTPRLSAEQKIKGAFNNFAAAVKNKGGRSVKRFVILHFPNARGQVTVLSKHLAEMLADSLRSQNLQRLERENLAKVFAEVSMNEMGSLKNMKTASVMGADILVIGEYALSGANIVIRTRATVVANTKVLHEQRWSVSSDKAMRAMAFQVIRSGKNNISATAGPGDIGRVWEADGFVLVAEDYTQRGATQGRLLDRVKQKIRKRLFSYYRNVLLFKGSVDDMERLFKLGDVEDAAFNPGAVYLKMKFRKPRGT